jgi:hypothetical protein
MEMEVPVNNRLSGATANAWQRAVTKTEPEFPAMPLHPQKLRYQKTGQAEESGPLAEGIRNHQRFFLNLYSTPTEMPKLTSICFVLGP